MAISPLIVFLLNQTNLLVKVRSKTNSATTVEGVEVEVEIDPVGIVIVKIDKEMWIITNGDSR